MPPSRRKRSGTGNSGAAAKTKKTTGKKATAKKATAKKATAKKATAKKTAARKAPAKKRAGRVSPIVRDEEVRGGNYFIVEVGPMEDRLKQAAQNWTASGRSPVALPTAEVFFVAQCWHYSSGTYREDHPGHDKEVTAYLAAGMHSIGGSSGWQSYIAQRDGCSGCGESYRLENLHVCTGCFRLFCYACSHSDCSRGGSLVG